MPRKPENGEPSKGHISGELTDQNTRLFGTRLPLWKLIFSGTEFCFGAARRSRATVPQVVRRMIDRQVGAAPAQPPLEYFVDADEIARMLGGLDPKTVQRMAREGVIPAYPFGEGPRKTWRFLPSEVHEWMRSRVHSESHPCRSNRRKPN